MSTFFFTLWAPRRHLAVERKRSEPFASAELAEAAAQAELRPGEMWVVTTGSSAIIVAGGSGPAVKRPRARAPRST